MKRYLIDTNIIRFYIEGILEVIKFWEECEANDDTLLLSMVTVGELRSQMIEVHPKHKSALRTLIKAFPTIEVTDSADRKAHAYRKMARCIRSVHEQEKKPFKPKLPELADAKIAVDAINEQIEIVTNNTKDFQIARFFGVSLYDPIRDIRFAAIEKTNEAKPKWILPDVKYE